MDIARWRWEPGLSWQTSEALSFFSFSSLQYIDPHSAVEHNRLCCVKRNHTFSNWKETPFAYTHRTRSSPTGQRDGAAIGIDKGSCKAGPEGSWLSGRERLVALGGLRGDSPDNRRRKVVTANLLSGPRPVIIDLPF